MVEKRILLRDSLFNLRYLMVPIQQWNPEVRSGWISHAALQTASFSFVPSCSGFERERKK